MLHRRTSLQGIDRVIDRIQRGTYLNLTDKWGDLDMYNRVYKKIDDKGSVSLERYVSEGEYEKVLFSEGNKVFFIQGESPSISNNLAVNDLWVVCIIKLTDFSERRDEQKHAELTTEIAKVIGLDNVKGLEYGLSNLKRIVEEPFQNSNFNFSDIHPYHVFMIKTEVEYQITINEC